MRLFIALLSIGCCLCRVPATADQLPLIGLARVSIRVADLDKARAFYSGLAGFEEAFDATNADGSVAAAYFKINDDQFLEIIPGLTADEIRPMAGVAIRTGQLEKLRAMLAARGLNPGGIRPDLDGSTGFSVTNLPGQSLDFLEFVQYGPESLAVRDKGGHLGANRLATRLEHFGISTTDFDAAYKFYTQTLGFHETYRRVTTDQSRVVLDHIRMPGPGGDVVELFHQAEMRGPPTRKRAASMAHFAFTVPEVKAVISAVQTRDPALHLGKPGYGLDNRWAFNLFDPDGTRMEFMQVVDPAHPTPAVAVTPPGHWTSQMNHPQ